MASLNSWLSPAVMRALGWALIHSLWQCLAVAALAALLMAFSRRPPLRYMIAVSALAVMLATPAATFFVLMNPAAPVQLATSPSMPPGTARSRLSNLGGPMPAAKSSASSCSRVKRRWVSGPANGHFAIERAEVT